jgi:molybdate transport system substrate-binding protein
MTGLRILSGGAAHGLVKALESDFTARSGLTVTGDFSAVGGLRARLLAGERPDLVILTAAILSELGNAGIVDTASITDIGAVATSIAVREADERPLVDASASLKSALLAADAIYFPDPALATAGIHFQRVLENLGILEDVRSRLRTFPNGATAMRALADARETRPIGCTQATEIVATRGVHLVADLPGEHALETMYTAGVIAGSPQAAAAAQLIAMMAAPSSSDVRRSCAFR